MKNLYLVEGDIAKVYSNGKNCHLYFIIDKEDLEKISDHSWRIYLNGNYYRTETSIAIGDKKNKHIILSRFLCDVHDGRIVDHIDCNPMNNRKSNLRITDHLGNSQNASKYRKSTSSLYKGVSLHKKKNKWISSIRANGISHHLGYFISEKDAAIAYNLKAKELHSEFAFLNKVE